MALKISEVLSEGKAVFKSTPSLPSALWRDPDSERRPSTDRNPVFYVKQFGIPGPWGS